MRGLGVALWIATSAALLVVVAHRGSPRVRLFLRCLRWGLATGAFTGAVVGALVVVPSEPDLVLAGAIYGSVSGIVVALIPTLIGSVYIADLLAQRHPSTSSDEEVRTDLTSVFYVVVGALDVIVVVVIVAVRAGSSVLVAIPFVVAANACMAVMLWRAGRSISRLWSATAR